MDSTEFRDFMHAQVREMQGYIKTNGGQGLDQKLSHEWAKTCSETFRRRWDASKHNTDSSVFGKEFSPWGQDQSSIGAL